MEIKVELDGDEIVVSKAGTDFEIAYAPRGEPNLVVKRSWVSNTEATPAFSDSDVLRFNAVAKARKWGGCVEAAKVKGPLGAP